MKYEREEAEGRSFLNFHKLLPGFHFLSTSPRTPWPPAGRPDGAAAPDLTRIPLVRSLRIRIIRQCGGRSNQTLAWQGFVAGQPWLIIWLTTAAPPPAAAATPTLMANTCWSVTVEAARTAVPPMITAFGFTPLQLFAQVILFPSAS